MQKQRALITGASSGIGRELAMEFAANGFDLVLVARSRDKLEQLAADLAARHSVQADVLCADLSDEKQVQHVHDETTRQKWTIDVLVNNAGFGVLDRFQNVPVDRTLQMIAVNVSALTHLTRLYLPDMLARGRGRILNVASTASFQPGPNVAEYFATKAYVLSLSEALWMELRGSGVTVTALAPGPTRTEFGAQAHIAHTPLFRFTSMEAQAVARAGFRATMAGRRLVVPGFTNKLTTLSAKIWPRQWVIWTTGKLHPLPK
jgi:uncharacterized protein